MRRRDVLGMLLLAVFTPALAGAQGAAVADGFYLVVDDESEQTAWIAYRGRDDRELVSSEPLMSFAEVTDARADVDKHVGMAVVHIALSEAGRRRFAALTTAHVGRRVAIVVQGQMVTAPRINEPIKGGELALSGDFDREEAAAIAAMLAPNATPEQAAPHACARACRRPTCAGHGPLPDHLGPSVHQRHQASRQSGRFDAAGGCARALSSPAGSRGPVHLRH